MAARTYNQAYYKANADRNTNLAVLEDEEWAAKARVYLETH